MRIAAIVPLLVLTWSCGVTEDERRFETVPFSDEVRGMEDFAAHVLSLKPPVEVVLSGPCMHGHFNLYLTDSNGTDLEFNYCRYRLGSPSDIDFPRISAWDCHGGSAKGDIEPRSPEELAIQIFAGIWVRSGYDKGHSNLAAMNLRQPSDPHGELRVVVRPIRQIVHYPEVLSRLRRLDQLSEEFGREPDRFWAFRLILCDGFMGTPDDPVT